MGGLLQAAPRAPCGSSLWTRSCPPPSHGGVLPANPPFIKTRLWSRAHPHDFDLTCSFAKTPSPDKATFTFTGTGVGRQFSPQHKPANTMAHCGDTLAALGGERRPPGPFISGSPPPPGTFGALPTSLFGEGFKEEVAATCVCQQGKEPGSAPVINLWKVASLSG